MQFQAIDVARRVRKKGSNAAEEPTSSSATTNTHEKSHGRYLEQRGKNRASLLANRLIWLTELILSEARKQVRSKRLQSFLCSSSKCGLEFVDCQKSSTIFETFMTVAKSAIPVVSWQSDCASHSFIFHVFSSYLSLIVHKMRQIYLSK